MIHQNAGNDWVHLKNERMTDDNWSSYCVARMLSVEYSYSGFRIFWFSGLSMHYMLAISRD